MQNSLDNYTIVVDLWKSATIAASRVFLYSELNKVLYYYIRYYIIQFLLIIGLSHCISWTEQHSWILACMHIFSAENTEQLIFPQWKLAYQMLGQVCLVFGVLFYLLTRLFPENCGFIPERGVNFLIDFFLLSYQYLPVASNFKIKVYLKRGLAMDDILTLHWWCWIVEHWIDASVQIDEWTVACFVHHIAVDIQIKSLSFDHQTLNLNTLRWLITQFRMQCFTVGSTAVLQQVSLKGEHFGKKLLIVLVSSIAVFIFFSVFFIFLLSTLPTQLFSKSHLGHTQTCLW